jgi:hypothetical protein
MLIDLAHNKMSKYHDISAELQLWFGAEHNLCSRGGPPGLANHGQ